jgi:predicted DCC family thiol-disulfide oxidoreductase YuxK
VILFDGVCNLVGKTRYRIFGENAACIVPDAGWRARVE